MYVEPHTILGPLLRAQHRLIYVEPHTILGPLLLGFFISVAIGRYSAKIPTSHVDGGFANGGVFTNLADP